MTDTESTKEGILNRKELNIGFRFQTVLWLPYQCHEGRSLNKLARWCVRFRQSGWQDGYFN